MPDSIWSAIGRKISFAISLTASRGVQCSPASSLFSSLKRRTSSSKIVPMAWLSRPGCLIEPSPFRTGLGLRLIERSRSFSIRVPSASAFDRRGIWLRNSNLSRISWTFGREAVEVSLEVGLELLLAARAIGDRAA